MVDEQRAERIRRVTLVLVDEHDRAVGELPPFEIRLPWLQVVEGLVRAARERFDVDVTVLRLLEATRRDDRFDAVFACEANPLPVALDPSARDLPDDAHRATFARPGGPAAEIDWARDALASLGIAVRSVTQHRTWNLSAIWSMETDAGRHWLKSVPPFFAHEGAVLDLLRDEEVPQLVAHAGQRLLMHDVEGTDRYDASVPLMDAMVERLVDLQERWSSRIHDLIAVGVPDLRGDELIRIVSDLVARNRAGLRMDEAELLSEFVDALPERMAALQACGIPDSIVHGDFHPGNWRGIDGAVRIIDWGDSFIGHPLLDPPELLEKAAESERAGLYRRWLDGWAARLPGADAHRAGELIEPLGYARMAAAYQMFVDNIEPAEHIHHIADIPEFLSRTARSFERGRADTT